MEPNPKYGKENDGVNEEEFIELILKDKLKEVKPDNIEEK
jgi:hypothetical protein